MQSIIIVSTMHSDCQLEHLVGEATHRDWCSHLSHFLTNCNKIWWGNLNLTVNVATSTLLEIFRTASTLMMAKPRFFVCPSYYSDHMDCCTTAIL